MTDGSNIVERARARLLATVTCIKRSRKLARDSHRLVQRAQVRAAEADARRGAVISLRRTA